MNAYTDKRACARFRHTAAIEFSHFNQTHCYKAQILNHCDEGMCFKSDVSLKPGAAVFMKLKNVYLNGICKGLCRGLRSASLAEVKWYKEISNEIDHFYEIGVKYYPSEY